MIRRRIPLAIRRAASYLSFGFRFVPCSRLLPNPMKYPKLSLCAALLLLPITVVRAAPIEVKLDAAKTGAPINPFIYGQFIEHLGRCIYGGIWAEMLEDRNSIFPSPKNTHPIAESITATSRVR
jgi:hypothetical protein